MTVSRVTARLTDLFGPMRGLEEALLAPAIHLTEN